MLGLRGCRLGLLYPEISEMQVSESMGGWVKRKAPAGDGRRRADPCTRCPTTPGQGRHPRGRREQAQRLRPQARDHGTPGVHRQGAERGLGAGARRGEAGAEGAGQVGRWFKEGGRRCWDGRRRVLSHPFTHTNKHNSNVEYKVGTMLELPRACLLADTLAVSAWGAGLGRLSEQDFEGSRTHHPDSLSHHIQPMVEFFSFGSNDLTQAT